jgi:hypothetical protein
MIRDSHWRFSRIRETLSVLDPFRAKGPGRKAIQERIDRLNAAVGTKLDSGPQFLGKGFEIWVL